MASVATTPTALERVRLVAGDIKLAHSVFAIPFAVLGAFLARPADGSAGAFAGQLALVVACMVFARTWAMLVNRLADRRFDAENPRTARRVFASGRMTPAQGWGFAVGAGTLFVGATALFWLAFANPWPIVLSTPVLAWIAFYSYTKRFTALSHVFLGGALAASPIAAAIAVNPAVVPRAPVLWFLAAMVVLWVAGFDVIYALQDVDFDRGRGLRSLPARLGPVRAIWVSRAMHAAALAFLLLAWRTDPRLGWLFGSGVAAVGVLLALEHAILAVRGRAGLDMAFFTVNGVVSCTLGVLGCLDLAGL